jgi:hypothetical protein
MNPLSSGLRRFPVVGRAGADFFRAREKIGLAKLPRKQTETVSGVDQAEGRLFISQRH